VRETAAQLQRTPEVPRAWPSGTSDATRRNGNGVAARPVWNQAAGRPVCLPPKNARDGHRGASVVLEQPENDSWVAAA